MREELPSWADDEPSERPTRASSRPWVFALAVVPWLVVLGLVATGSLPRGDRASPRPPTSVGEEGAARAIEERGTAAADGQDPPSAAGRGESRPPPAASPRGQTDRPRRPAASAESAAGLDPRVVAIASTVARAWVTDVGPHLEIEGISTRADGYLEHSSVEAVDLAGEHAVVTLVAVVLERNGDTYTRAKPRRLAVPVVLGDPPRPAGEPWWLPDADLTVVEPDLSEERDPELLLALGEHLSATGATTGEVLEAGRTTDGWWVVTTGPTTDAEGEPSRIWLPPDIPFTEGGAASQPAGSADDQE